MSPNHSHRPNATIFRKAGGVPCPHGSTVTKPPLPLSMCIKVEEWLKSSEKTKVKLICTPHKLPLQKITTQRARPSLTLQLPPTHVVPLKLTHSSTSQGISLTLQLLPHKTRNSPTLQLTHSSTSYMVYQTWPFHVFLRIGVGT